MSALLPRGTTGVYVPIEDGHGETARELEILGFDTLWIAGGQLDRLSRISELLEATTVARVATGIVPLGVFGTAEIAALQRDADERFVLGLGGPQLPRPLAALAGRLDELDAAGSRPAARLLAALGPRKLTIAAERAAGAITLLTTPEFTATARARLGAKPTLAVHDFVALNTDAARARAAIREHVAFLARVQGYRANLLRMGFDEREDLDALSDRLVDAVSGWGDVADIGARIQRHRDAGADHVAVKLLAADGPAAVIAAAETLAAELMHT